ncbi:MAG TPA: DUF2914 domain-containing protein [Methylotenera sp.]|nr:DUF2914 domain-containing protein [Methylotenera sp.]
MNVTIVKKYFPALAFFAGFIWDALTIGRSVNASDLLILSAYLIATIPIIWWLAKKAGSQIVKIEPLAQSSSSNLPAVESWKTRLPYILLQFLFGSLFCALFILYFKSSSHVTAIMWSIGLGALLVANEFLETAYKRFTLTWTLFGFCAILLLNFVLPFVVGSVHAFWFFASILVALTLTQSLKNKISAQLGNIIPTYIVAAVIASAYVLDVIPPVPLVKRDIQVGVALTKKSGQYIVQQDKAPWWIFWRSTLDSVHISAGDKVYCISAIFAPSGLETKLYHRWQRYDANKGWLTMPRIGFSLTGGRNNGFRGYTYKQNVAYGKWRVIVETENERTIAIHEFEIEKNEGDQPKLPIAL